MEGNLDFQMCLGKGVGDYSCRGRGVRKIFFSLPPKPPRPLSSFDTHARWQPMTQSVRSRQSYRKIEDFEQSRRWVTAWDHLYFIFRDPDFFPPHSFHDDYSIPITLGFCMKGQPTSRCWPRPSSWLGLFQFFFHLRQAGLIKCAAWFQF